MRLSEFCIQRPVFTIVMSLVLIVVGLMGYQGLTGRQNPGVANPVIAIITQYPGADAALVEGQITTPIEEVLTGISGLKMLRSNSEDGKSFVKALNLQ